MRLLLFADLHLDAQFAWAGRELARARRRALRDCLSKICELATTLKVDAVCCGGDLYEQERFTPDTASFLRDQLDRLTPIPVFLAPGNHDWLGPASLYRQVNWSGNVHVFAEPRLEPITIAEGFTVWGAAHCAPANTDGFLDGFAVDRGGVHVALFHGSEQSDLVFQEAGKTPHAPFRAQQIRNAGLHHALVGHFHTPRDRDHHTYPGNPEPLTFGETGERGAVLITVDSAGGVTRERHRVAVSHVTDVNVSLDGIAYAHQIRDRVAAALAPLTGTVRLTVEGEVGPDVEVDLGDLAGVAPHLNALVPRLGRIRVAYDLEALAEERTVRGQFVRDVRSAPDLTGDQRRRVLITGLRAFDSRQDLEGY